MCIGAMAKLRVSFPGGTQVENGSDEGLQLGLQAEDACGLAFVPDDILPFIETGSRYLTLSADRGRFWLHADVPSLKANKVVTLRATDLPCKGFELQVGLNRRSHSACHTTAPPVDGPVPMASCLTRGFRRASP